MLSTAGLLFAFGKENSEGQLGTGDTLPKVIPTIIEVFRKNGEKVSNVSCGFKHTICKTSSGKIYSWGGGDCGQLGLGEETQALSPSLVKIDYISSNALLKILQIKANYISSMILLENGKIFYWGSISTNEKVKIPKEFDLGSILEV